MTKSTTHQRLQWARLITFSLYSLLLLCFCLWQLTRPTGPAYFFWVLQTVPLLIFIPGMRANNPRTYISLCFVLLLYFIRGVEGVVFPSRAWIDYAVLSISILLFISAMLTSRWAAMSQNNKMEPT